jgi:hypothetical protein
MSAPRWTEGVRCGGVSCGVTLRMEDGQMLFTGPRDDEPTDGHEGYVAGRYRNGTYSDSWTDVVRCAEQTFTAYAPACKCGWRGPAQPASEVGYAACQHALLRDHLKLLDVGRPILGKIDRPVRVADFLP